MNFNGILHRRIRWLTVLFISGLFISARRPVEFIGPEGFHGSFFETVFQAAGRLMFP
jgi:hypothetical protein